MIKRPRCTDIYLDAAGIGLDSPLEENVFKTSIGLTSTREYHIKVQVTQYLYFSVEGGRFMKFNHTRYVNSSIQFRFYESKTKSHQISSYFMFISLERKKERKIVYFLCTAINMTWIICDR
jgi:hypothetical protein